MHNINIINFGKYYGVNIKNNNIKKTNRILIIGVNNRINSKITMVREHLLRLVYRLSKLVNYTNTHLVCSENMDDECYIKNIIKSYREYSTSDDTNIDLLIIAKNDISEHINEIKKINNDDEIIYYNLTSNEIMIDNNKIKYHSFISFVEHFKFKSYVDSYINNYEYKNIKLNNGIILNTNNYQDSNSYIYDNIECFLLIESDNIPIIEIGGNNYEIKEYKDKDYDIEYLDEYIIFIKSIRDNTSIMNHIFNLNNIKTKRMINEKDKDIRLRTIWIDKFIKSKFNLLIKDRLKQSEENIRNIYDIILNTRNTLRNKKLKNKMNNIIIKNIKLIDDIDDIYYLDDKQKIFIENNNNNPLIEKSKTLFYSLISISDWFEELENGSSMGLMVEISRNVSTNFAFKNSNIRIKDISLSCLSVQDYFSSVIYTFKNRGNKNINNKIIYEGAGIGNCNAIIPLYINEEHWKQSKKQLPFVLGYILANNPLAYNKNHDNFLFYFLTNMGSLIINNNNLNIKIISLYLAVLRTCYQIAIEKGYHIGIKKLVDKYINDETNETSYMNNIMIGQILSTGMKLNNNHIIIIIRKQLLLNDDINKMISFYIMYNVIQEIVNTNGEITIFMNVLDRNFGVVPDDISNKILNKLRMYLEIKDKITSEIIKS